MRSYQICWLAVLSIMILSRCSIAMESPSEREDRGLSDNAGGNGHQSKQRSQHGKSSESRKQDEAQRNSDDSDRQHGVDGETQQDLRNSLWQRIKETVMVMTPDGLLNLNIPGAAGGEPKVRLKKMGTSTATEDYDISMTQEMNRKCITAAKYKTDAATLLTDTYQCSHWKAGVEPQAVENNNYFGGKGKQIVVGSNTVVRDALKTWANARPMAGNGEKWVTTSQLDNLKIYNTAGATNGTMCAMPGPPGRMKNFWKKCVMPKGGYFNLAYCEEDGASAVLGIAFVESNMCYPAHMHIAEEAYWQVAGTGKWKIWHSHKKTNDMKIFEGGLPIAQKRGEKLFNVEVKTGAAGGKHFHPATLAHEFSTDSGEFMIMVYWWGMGQNKAPNDYRFVRETMAGAHKNSGCAKDFFTASPSDQKAFGQGKKVTSGIPAGGHQPQVPFDSEKCKADIFSQEGAASIFSYCGGCCDQKHWMYKSTVFSGCEIPSACRVEDCCIAKSPPPPAPPAPVSADMTCKAVRVALALDPNPSPSPSPTLLAP